MANETAIMGLFDSDQKAARAIHDLKTAGWSIAHVHGPVPGHRVTEALALKKSRVGWFTLTGGIIGFFSGFSLAAFTAGKWSLIISGKPVFAWIPFFIVGFEFTILFSVLGNIIGLLSQMRLPSYEGLKQYDQRLSGEHFGVKVACGPEKIAQLEAFFREKGAIVRRFDPEMPQ